jgi:hypothetical protein
MQQSAPFAETRSNYLVLLSKQGYARATVRAARDILGVAERVEMSTVATPGYSSEARSDCQAAAITVARRNSG